ncbi:minor tail protein [Arthrobacter phage Caterpillar]|nr:minor tail protein [Arthrobacter phage Caterpillar]
MATIVTNNLARTQEVVDGTVVDGTVDGSKNLTLDRRDGVTIPVGNVGGPKGFTGPERPQAAGQVSLYAGSEAPYGWMLCDGRHLSRTEYSELYSVIGTRYGTGDGSTTFQVPDFRGRLGVGHDVTQSEFDVLGEFGGQKKVTLTIDHLPAHTHNVLGYKSKDDSNFSGNNNRLNAADGTVAYDKETTSTGGSTNTWHNNLQPYLTVNYIISVGHAAPQGGGTPPPLYFTTKSRGTTAQRDAEHGVPATDAARVTLANKRVSWFNADLGWEESYYAVTGTTGLTVPGLLAGATSGWYPIGAGPMIIMEATAGLWVVWNAHVGNFGITQRKGGASWFTSDGTLTQVLKHGRYDIKAWTQILEGSGSPDFVLQVLAADGTTYLRGTGGGSFEKDPTFRVRAHLEAYDMLIEPNQKVGFKLQQGTMSPTGGMTLHNRDSNAGVGGQMIIRYVGPPLVAEH